MTRLQAFALVGPLVGFLVSLPMASNLEFKMLWLILIFAYIYGIVPALIACAIDWFFASKLSRWKRVPATALATFFVFVVLGLVMGGGLVSDTLAFGAACALAAAVCSALSGIGMAQGA
jgi:hypothetical protein